MHEIIYLQAGSFANYIGQHFWNTQESYFDYNIDENDDEEIIANRPDANHDVSFRQGIASDGSETYLPRALIFDHKDAFGSLPKINELYESLGGGEDESTGDESWLGSKTVIRQPIRSKAQVQRQPDNPRGATLPPGDTSASTHQDSVVPSTWADYTNVYYHPRSLYSVPYPLSGSFDTVDEGVEAFARLDQEDDIWETGFRLFMEECDLFQGLQVTCDASTAFASLTTAFLARFRDECPKHPILTFLPLSPIVQPFEPYNLTARRRLSCETRTIFDLSEMAATVVPLQHPSIWTKGAWSSHLNLDTNLSLPYHTSALLSAAIETATLPLRLNSNAVGLAALTDLLNYHGDTPISHLTSLMPLNSTKEAVNAYDFSASPGPPPNKVETWSASASYRGTISNSLVDDLTDVLRTHFEQQEPLLQISFSSLKYPFLSSFPPILPTAPRHTSVLSTLLTSSASSVLLEWYGDSLRSLLDNAQWAGLGESWDREAIKELSTGMQNLKEAYTLDRQQEQELTDEDEDE